MSIETQLQALIDAVTANTKAVELNTKAFLTVLESRAPAKKEVKQDAPTQEEVLTQEEVITEVTEKPKTTHDMLIEVMLNAARNGKKEDSRKVLNTHGYKKVSDVPQSELEKMIRLVKEL